MAFFLDAAFFLGATFFFLTATFFLGATFLAAGFFFVAVAFVAVLFAGVFAAAFLGAAFFAGAALEAGARAANARGADVRKVRRVAGPRRAREMVDGTARGRAAATGATAAPSLEKRRALRTENMRSERLFGENSCDKTVMHCVTL